MQITFFMNVLPGFSAAVRSFVVFETSALTKSMSLLLACLLACFGHNRLINGLQRVQNAICVVSNESPQVRCGMSIGVALDQP